MRQILKYAALALVALTLVALRVVWSSRQEWRAATAAIDPDARRAHLGLAARLYAPGNPWSERALSELAAMGRQGGAPGLAAWQEARGAILATRSFYTPHPALLAEADAAIAAGMAERDAPSRGTLDERRAWHAARLAQAVADAPSVGWTLVALMGLAVWVGAAVAFCLRGLDEQARLRQRVAAGCAAGVAVGLALFFLGLARA